MCKCPKVKRKACCFCLQSFHHNCGCCERHNCCLSTGKIRERSDFIHRKSEETEPVDLSLKKKLRPKEQDFLFVFNDEKKKVKRSLAEILEFFGIIIVFVIHI